MNLRFHHQVFVRTANKSLEEFNYQDLELIIKAKEFQHAIFFASESLYQELEQHQFNYDVLPEKVKTSLKKYYNRLCFRATPFGLFASTGVLNWGSNTGESIYTNNSETYIYPDFQLLTLLGEDFARQPGKHVRYFVNQTLYRVTTSYRYISFSKDGTNNHFQLNLFESDPFFLEILKYSQVGKHKVDLIHYCLEHGVDHGEATSYIEQIINAGILYPETIPHHVGSPYFIKLFTLLDNFDSQGNRRHQWAKLLNLFNRSYSPQHIPLKKITGLKWD